MRVLITGATGMDGWHLIEHLSVSAAKPHVFGMIRHPDHPRADALREVGVKTVVADLLDASSLRRVISDIQPDVIYHLGALSAPGVAWDQPELCGEVTGLGTLRLLDATWDLARHARVIVAGSLATHGPYGAAKAYARIVAADYRSRGLSVTTMIMGGHHSPLRGRTYLSQKVAQHAGQVWRYLKSGGRAPTPHRLSLGPLTRLQDWGWAPDFMEVWSRAHLLAPDDYVLSTGAPYSAIAWVEECYHVAGAHWSTWVDIEDQGGNATDVPSLTADPDPRLGFIPSQSFSEIISTMVGAASYDQ